MSMLLDHFLNACPGVGVQDCFDFDLIDQNRKESSLRSSQNDGSSAEMDVIFYSMNEMVIPQCVHRFMLIHDVLTPDFHHTPTPHSKGHNLTQCTTGEHIIY